MTHWLALPLLLTAAGPAVAQTIGAGAQSLQL